MRKFEVIALILLIVGGINWGVWSVFEFNLIGYIFGKTWIDRVLYFFMGVAGIYGLLAWKGILPKLRK